jgi:hypothetical protein
MRVQKYIGLFYLAILCLPVFMLIGCTFWTTGTTTAPAATATSDAPALAGSPKGSGGVNSTATTVSSPCSTISTPPASTSGWKIYKDSRFSFQFAIPPGWRAGSFTDDSGNDYIVQVFPPGSTTPIGQAGLADQEHIAIAIALSGPTGTYANDPNWKVEAGSISISGKKVMIYDRTSPDCGEVNRGTTADFEQHHFTFFMTSIPEKAKKDVALFLGTLQGFVYTK